MQAVITHLNINSAAVQRWIPQLEAINRSAFPIAIRKTLNQTALDVKRVSMPMETDKAFHKRKPTFFSATSHVQFAEGFNVNNMAAIVGFIAPPGVKESGHATKDLNEQEQGGDIDKRAFIATKEGRTGRGNVRDNFAMKKIKNNIVDAKNEQGKNGPEKFIKAAIKAGVGNFVITPWSNQKGNKYLALIQRLKKGKKGGMIISYKEIYNVKKQRKAHVKATHFMHAAADDSAAKMEKVFNDNVAIEINKIRNK